MTTSRRAPARTVLHIRVDKDLVRQLDHLAVDLEARRPQALEAALRVGLAEIRRRVHAGEGLP